MWGRRRWALLNNKIFTFHDLFTFTESIDKQQQLVRYGVEGYCDLLDNFANFLFIVHAILQFKVLP